MARARMHTEKWLDMRDFFAILSRMNGFRITILTLLCLSMGLMFYAVFFVVPSWQGEFNAYQASQRISQFDRKSDFHRQQMVSYDPDSESPEVAKARLAAEAAAKQNDKTVMEAEETAVLAAAKRREEAQRVQAEREAEAARAAAEKTPPMGVVASYDPAWQSVMIKPSADHASAYARGAALAVYRAGNFLAEVVVDSLDVESGQVSATLRIPQGMPGVNADGSIAPEREPKAGDMISVSPFLSADDLRAEVGTSLLDAAATAEEAAPANDDALPSYEDTESEPTGAQAPAAAPRAPEPVQPPSDDVRRALESLPGLAPAQSPAAASALPTMDPLLQPSLF